MITKKLFISFLQEWENFKKGIERVEDALSGESRYSSCNLFECDWFVSVEKMYDIFLESNFTDYGIDLINWYIFEDVNHIIYEKEDKDLFNEEKEVKIELNSLEDLWDYLYKNRKDYILNAD